MFLQQNDSPVAFTNTSTKDPMGYGAIAGGDE